MEATTDHGHSHEGGMTTIGKVLMLVAVFGGFWLVRTLQDNGTIHMPGWATTLLLAIAGILIGGGSTVVPEVRGGKAATYVGFVLVAISILMMFNGWIFHIAGK